MQQHELIRELLDGQEGGGRMSDELKPCPFCGGVAWTITNSTVSGGKVVGVVYGVMHKCDEFGTLFSRKYDTEADAIAAWNHRATTITHAVIVSDESTDCATGHCECELCGSAIDPWDKYCRHCGAEVEQ